MDAVRGTLLDYTQAIERAGASGRWECDAVSCSITHERVWMASVPSSTRRYR